jgi:putative ABC transport system permease protein
LTVAPRQFEFRGTGRVSVLGRLRPEITIAQARERLTARMPDRQWRDGTTSDVRAIVESSVDRATTPNRTMINILSGAVALILLIAIVNVAAVLLARGATRESELALRVSLGAGRGRMLRQLLTESLVLAVVGGVVGVLLAWTSLGALVASMPLRLPDNSPIAVNLTVLAGTGALLVPTALLFGLLPALRLSRVRIPPALARQHHPGSQFGRRGGQLLIATETALALILLAGAGLMIRSYARIAATDLGFNPDRLLTMETLPLDRNLASHRDYYTALLQRIRTLPGISSAGLIDNFALGGGTSYSTFDADGKSTFSTQFSMMPGYLETIDARIRHGRLLTEADYASGFHGAVINESAARAMFSTAAAVGRTFTKNQQADPVWTVVGVIGDIRHRGPVDTRSRNEPQIFFPFEPAKDDRIQAMTIVMRTNGGTTGLAAQLRRTAESIGPRVLIEHIRTANESFGERVITPRRQTVLLSLLGALGLVLSLVGIFGITAYWVTRRVPEIGVRMAFGARPGQVVASMLRDASMPIAIGTVLGIGGSLIATPLIKSFLFETAPTDVATLATVATILAVAAGLAALIPARRAALVDPAISLKAE